MTSTISAHRALLLLGSARLPSAVLRTRSSAGMPWDFATLAQLIYGARTSRLLRNSRPAPSTATATASASAKVAVKPQPQFARAASLDALTAASEDYLICMAAALATSAAESDKTSLMLSTSIEVAKQVETANYLASEAAKTQAAAQKQAQINLLRAAIQSVTALLEHELLVLDFAGAIVIGLILIDLNNQLARLLQ